MSHRYAAGVIAGVLLLLLVGLAWVARRTLESAEPLPRTASGREPPVGETARPEPDPAAAPPQIVTSAVDGLDYAFLAPGEFLMGCVPDDGECDPDERPRHLVVIPRAFGIGTTEVTVDAYRRFAAATGRDLPEPPPFNPSWDARDHPMVNVGLGDAIAYCQWAGGRLPTEAEWEYAARGGGSGARYPWGEECGAGTANRKGISPGDRWEATAPVRSFPANVLGLFNMAGNVWEWVQDEWHPGYDGAPADGSAWGVAGVTGPAAQSAVLRGGSWVYGCRQLRTSHRARWFWPGNRFDDYGFRCARDAPP